MAASHFRRIIRHGYCVSVRCLLTAAGVRPIILLDSTFAQLAWLSIERADLITEGLRQGMLIRSYRTAAQLPPLAPHAQPLDLAEVYRGVRLFPAIQYSVYASLAVARHEFDPENIRHQQEAQRWLRYARRVTDELLALFSKQRPVAVVVMQGHFIEDVIARQLSTKFRFQVFALENTFFSERLICEPLTGVAVNNNCAMAWFHRLHDKTGSPPGRYFAQLMPRLSGSKHKDHSSPTEAFSWPTNRKRILFLGQCFTDSSLLFGNRGSYSTVEITRALLTYAADTNSFVFLKMHPKEAGGATPFGVPYDRLTARKLALAGVSATRASPPFTASSFFLDDKNDFATPSLMQTADVIVTINSQGGLEALAWGKEVVLLGNSFYDKLGVTWNVPDLSVLAPVLDSILFGSRRLADTGVVARFLEIYFEHYCIPRTASGLVEALRSRRFDFMG